MAAFENIPDKLLALFARPLFSSSVVGSFLGTTSWPDTSGGSAKAILAPGLGVRCGKGDDTAWPFVFGLLDFPGGRSMCKSGCSVFGKPNPIGEDLEPDLGFSLSRDVDRDPG
jgi:hypothetical protein